MADSLQDGNICVSALNNAHQNGPKSLRPFLLEQTAVEEVNAVIYVNSGKLIIASGVNLPAMTFEEKTM